MKKIITFFLLLSLVITSFSQQTKSSPTLTKQDYLQKSKKQKTAGVILLAGGAGLIITSFIIPKGALVYDGICIGQYCDDKYKNDGIKSAFFIAGGISALSSIPLFIVSGKNRKKAGSVSFKNEHSAQLYNQSLVYASFPAVRLKIIF